MINDHATVGDNEASDSFSNCSETFSTCSVSSTDSELIDDDEFLDYLHSWAAKFNIKHTALQSLMAILRPHHTELPKDPRTSMKTNYNSVAITWGFLLPLWNKRFYSYERNHIQWHRLLPRYWLSRDAIKD